MHKKFASLRATFPHTIPVLAGFLFLGIAYGILMSSSGYHVGWTFLMSLFIYAGSMQFVAVSLLTSAFNPLYAFLLTLMVNARHLFYGLSLLQKFKNTGAAKPYLIFGLCDETFSILCSTEPPDGVGKTPFMLAITLLNQSYWVIGSVLGGLVGALLPFHTTGIDFAMTALFVVIFINQWKTQKNHAPALTGLLSTALCLILFGPDRFLIPSMAVILLLFTLFRKPYERGEAMV